MKKWFVVLAVLLLMVFAASASAEVDHSMISIADEHLYCWLASENSQNYTMDYSCLMTNTDTSGGVTVKLYVSIIDADGKEIYKLGETSLFCIKAGETRAIQIERGGIQPEVRDQARKCELIWVACDKYDDEGYADRTKYWTPLPVYDLTTGGVDGHIWSKCYFDNPFDAKISSDYFQSQIELYDKNDGHLVYCGSVWWGHTFEEKPLRKGCMLQGTSAIPDMIGIDYDIKIRLEYYGNPK